MSPLDLVRLTALMEHTQGRPKIVIGLIDGPVILNHPDLAAAPIRAMPGRLGGACARSDSAACQHGTFVAGILSARRGSSAPAICPGCTLLVRPIFSEAAPANGDMPSAKPEELAESILDCIRAGAHVLNISAAIAQLSSKTEGALEWMKQPSAAWAKTTVSLDLDPFSCGVYYTCCQGAGKIDGSDCRGNPCDPGCPTDLCIESMQSGLASHQGPPMKCTIDPPICCKKPWLPVCEGRVD